MEKGKLYSEILLVCNEWYFEMAGLHIAIMAGSVVASQGHSLLQKLIDTSSFFLGQCLPWILIWRAYSGLTIVCRSILRDSARGQDGSTKR
jgi:hypothetical protein